MSRKSSFPHVSRRETAIMETRYARAVESFKASRHEYLTAHGPVRTLARLDLAYQIRRVREFKMYADLAY